MWRLATIAGSIGAVVLTRQRAMANMDRVRYLNPAPKLTPRWVAGANESGQPVPMLVMSIGRSGFAHLSDRGQYLAPKAAMSFNRMARAALADGVDLEDQLVSSFRTWPHQENLHSIMSHATAPGRSAHQRGTAVDINTLSPDGPDTQAWLVTNAARYGWRRTYGNPAHWEHFG